MEENERKKKHERKKNSQKSKMKNERRKNPSPLRKKGEEKGTPPLGRKGDLGLVIRNRRELKETEFMS